MNKKYILLGVRMALSLSAFTVDKADQVLTAFKAKKDKDVAALVQAMATDLDFAGLEKIREKAPEVFDVKYFPSEFVSGVIFKYVETKAAQQKPVPAAKTATANPNKKGTWQYVYFDLQKAWATREKTTDPATLEKLTAQVNQYGAQLEGLMANMGYEQKMEVGMAIHRTHLASRVKAQSLQC